MMCVGVNGPGNPDLWTLKLVCESHQRWGTFLPNLGTLDLWVLELFAIYATDGQKQRLPYRAGGIINRPINAFKRLLLLGKKHVCKCLLAVYVLIAHSRSHCMTTSWTAAATQTTARVFRVSPKLFICRMLVTRVGQLHASRVVSLDALPVATLPNSGLRNRLKIWGLVYPNAR